MRRAPGLLRVIFLKTSGVFENWVNDCPLQYTSPNAPQKRDVLGTILLSVLAGHWRYAHISALRGDGVKSRVARDDEGGQVENPTQPPRSTFENHPSSPSQTGRVPAPGLIQKQGLFRYPWSKR